MLKFFSLSIMLISFIANASVCDQHQNCRNKFYAKDNFLTYFSTHNLNKSNLEIERLVIVVHGALRNGHDYFDDTVKAAKKFNVHNKTIVLAPSFRKVTDEREDGELYWGRRWYTKWKYGYVSQDSDQISSFRVIDDLILSIAKSGNFKKLKEIVVTGHSAGGQFTQRYAIATKIRNKIAQRIKFVPSNPSSYMFLDPIRYEFKNSNFQHVQVDSSCGEYNHYIYGPIDRPSYFKGSVDDLKQNYKNNQVTFLMSEQDKGTDSLDRTCEAMTQGSNRFERSQNFWHYSKNHLSSKRHRFVSIPKIGHEHIDVYESSQAGYVVFGLEKKKSEYYLYKRIGNHEDVERKTEELFVLFGGGKNETNGFKELLRAARGGDVLVLSAKSHLNHRYTHDMWNIALEHNIAINSVSTISFLDKNAGDENFIINKINSSEVIFFTGGNQAKYINRIKGTSAHKSILEKVRTGTPIGGTSAGLAIMGEFIFSAQRGAISSSYVLRNPNTKYITLERDFFYSPILRHLVTDTHFSERGREGRLLGFMYRVQLDYNQKEVYGLGVDERSSLVLRRDSMRAFGGVSLYRSQEEHVKRLEGRLKYKYIKKRLPQGRDLEHFSMF